jgi:N-acetylmuramoyl-L-alanine amidase
METIFYLFRVSACVAGFYIVYYLIFRNITAFKLNRAFLVAGLIVSVIVPSLDLSFVPPDYHLDAAALISTVSVDEEPFYAAEIIAPVKANSLLLLPLLYWIGVLICSLRISYGVFRIFKLRGRSKISTTGAIKVFESDIDEPFSFFNTIYLPQHEIDEAIVEHEKTHVWKYHWFDLLVAEIVGIFLWFNPVMIFYKRSLKMQHEYEADAAVLLNGTPVENYLDCMLRHLQSKNSGGLTSSFFSQNIKQRILMMTKNKTSRSYKLLYLLFVPVMCGLLAAFSNAPVKTNEIVHALTPTDPNEVVILVDPGHGGQDAGSQAFETTEKDLTLSIARLVQSAGEKRGVKVILTRTGDQATSLEDRLAMVKRFKADMFLSIHLNYHPEDASKSGIDIMVSDKNQKFEESNRIAGKLNNELNLLGTLKVNGITNSNFYVLSRNSIPATLIELGYLSNKADHAYLSDAKNQVAVSEKIINAVVASAK